jgi:5'-3' exonuclease
MPIIAPLWTDFRSANTMYRVTDDPDTLQLVREMISSRNPNLRNYQPSLAVVVTVEDVEISSPAHLDVRILP